MTTATFSLRLVLPEVLDAEDALSLRGAVVHRGTPDTFGVEFHQLTASDQNGVRNLIGRLHSRL